MTYIVEEDIFANGSFKGTMEATSGVLNSFVVCLSGIALKDLYCKSSFSSLSLQHYLEPPVKLREALERYGLKGEDFFVLKHGESRYLNTDDKAFEET